MVEEMPVDRLDAAVTTRSVIVSAAEQSRVFPRTDSDCIAAFAMTA